MKVFLRMTSQLQSNQYSKNKILLKKSLKSFSLLAEGGEGWIYDYSTSKVLKIFKESVNKNEKEIKIQSLLKLSLPDEVCKPIHLAYDSKGDFCGYTMKKLHCYDLRQVSSKKFVTTHSITKKILLELLQIIGKVISQLHTFNIVIGDLTDSNIVFSLNPLKVYFIDVDSWSIGSYRCQVINEVFKDPLLTKDKFTAETDNFAFAIIAYKTLTRLHPFAGVLLSSDQMAITDRIKHQISVIDRKDILIPSIVDKDTFFPSTLKQELKTIFETSKRFLINDSIHHFFENLIFCDQHNDYFQFKR